MQCHFSTVLLILHLFENARGNSAVPTGWMPMGWRGQTRSGTDSRSIYNNITQLVYPTSGPNIFCPLNCSREPVEAAVYSWSPATITATITAATVIHVVNTNRNITKDITITNTEADLRNFTAPTNTNSLGTRTYIVTDVAPDGTGTTTYPLVFPSLYTRYDPQVTFRGILPTTIGGTPTCLRAINETLSSFPVHPTLEETPGLPITTPAKGFDNVALKKQADGQNSQFALDPRGWTWVPDFGISLDVAQEVEELIPDLGVWSCKRLLGTVAAPATYLGTALYLTQTSTMSVGDNDIQDGHASQSLMSAVKGGVSTARRLPSASNVEAQATSAQAESAIFSSVLAALRGSKPGPVTPVPELQSASVAEGIPRAGIPITAAAKVSGLPKGGSRAPPIAIGGKTFAANAQSQYIVSGQTLAIGSSITLGSGSSATLVGLQASGSQTELVVGSSTSLLPPPVLPTAPPLTIGSQVYPADSQGQYIIGGQTLTPGGSVNVNGTPISLATDDSQLVVGSLTEHLDDQPPTGSDLGADSPAETAFTGAASARTFSLMVTLAPGLGIMLLLL